MPFSLLPLVFFFSLLLFCSTNLSHAYKQCTSDQKALLLDLKNELKFPSYSPKLVRWNQTNNCCSWDGVECNGDGHVISLELAGRAITGGLDSSSSLFRLKHLKKLDLALNYFNRIQIPREIGNLTYLTHLDLGYADFGGQIPIEISLLTRLVSLYLTDRDRDYGNDVHSLKLENPDLGMVLRNLTRLEVLHLDGVDLSTNKIEWYNIIFSSLPNLMYLSLVNCGLSSPRDPSLLQLHSLTYIILDRNNLSTTVSNFFINFLNLTFLSLNNCSLPKNFFGLNSSITLPNLIYLDLRYNSLSGSIPQSLFGLPSLQTLYLSKNQFSGTLHEFTTLNFSNIKKIDLSSNQLEGPIPESFFQLESIEFLVLSDNLFNGTFQLEKIQRLPNLTRLELSHNKNLSVDASTTNSSVSVIYPPLEILNLASCNLYYFPDFIKQSQTLFSLDLSNNRIVGEIPSWIWEIGNGTLSDLNLSSNLLVELQKPYKFPDFLWQLDLHSNKLQGELPLPPQQANYVDYSNNNFFNSIPPNIGNITSSLQFFSLKNNSISGSIPPSLCSSYNLFVLDLSLNKLTGTIPPCLLYILEVLDLGSNNISGHIPDKFPSCYRLSTLELGDNSLTGHIPLSLANCKSLEVVNVRNNKMNDTFPCMLSSSLRILVLRSNRFYGRVGCNNTWPNLQIIDIASNHFSGNLHPKIFSSWRGMVAINDAQLRLSHLNSEALGSGSYYQNKVTLTIKGLELELVKIWPDFTSIDFSHNNFKGEIPEAIGDLTSLCLLNLSHNALTGEIPKSLGNLRDLESLDLSVNELRGIIPMGLAKLTFLSVLNLSNNKLVGEIPIGPQLQRFSPDSFEGNMGLCGEPTNISCWNNTEEGSVELEEKRMEIEWEHVSIVFGYVVGLGSFVWVLFGCMSFRNIYFYKIDEILGNIFVRHNSRRRRRRHGRRVGRNEVRRR